MQNDNQKTPEKKLVSESTRRSFIRKAAIGAPVIVASSAKPAWATTDCFSPSGMMSGNTSHPEAHKIECDQQAGGRTPTDWKNCDVNKYRRDRGYTKSQMCKKLGISRNSYDNVRDKFYCHSGSFISLSKYGKNDRLGANKLVDLLSVGDDFDCEIATAKLNAAQKALTGCPLTEADVDKIYLGVLDGKIEHEKATQTLRRSRGAYS